MNRRNLLKASAASLSYFGLSASRASTQNAKPKERPPSNNKKLVWIVLRGGADSLHTTMPLFDADFLSLRNDFVMPIKDQLLPIDRDFALHPELKFMHSLHQANQLNTVIATATPYRSRSHFASQDGLESGLGAIDVDNGWLARMTKQVTANINQPEALAIARSIPVSLRGGSEVITWYPSNLKSNDDDLYARLMDLYEYDQELSSKLEQALETQALVSKMGKQKKQGKLSNLAESCATLMSQANGPDIAMLEMGGWDTHNRQEKRLSNNLKELDKGIKALHTGLNTQWDNTLFIIATEFGRTVHINGTGGTDHGTATALYIGGGAVNGGKVLGRWPGLAKDRLYEARDLAPTSDTFSWISAAVSQHFGLTHQEMAMVFPDTLSMNTKIIHRA